MSLLKRVLSGLGVSKQTERDFFDQAYYNSAYADVAAARVDAFAHFMDHGWREGRNPSRTFNTLFYRDGHLNGAELNPLTHYVEAGGRASGLATLPPTGEAFVKLQRPIANPLFDYEFYRLQTDTTAQDLLGHYLTTGWRQGLPPSATFNVQLYADENAFLTSLNVSPLYHYASQERMRRTRTRDNASGPEAVQVSRDELIAAIKPEFDERFYLSRYQDVRLARLEPFTHFIDHGMDERRDPNALFNSAFYLADNPELERGTTPAFYHYVTQGRREGRRGNPTGPRIYPPLAAPSAEAWTRAVPAADTAGAEYIVIMPVYKGYDESLASIHAVLTARQTVRFALHVVNDTTPDKTLDAALADLAGKGLFSYSRNTANLGFVKTCNRALRQFADKAVVLLNADTEVYGDWLDRIDRHAKCDATIATITPLSNNATICSYPHLNDNNLIEPERPARELDRLAARCNAGRVSDIPTGVGFCFYMSRASRDAIGLFDEEAFGIGYGEENDFCLRAGKAGFRNVLAEDIFVYHAGQVSFAELAASEYGPGQKALLGKHPEYPLVIRQHLEADPSFYGRMRLDLMRLADYARSDCVVFVSHALKGGIVTHIEHMEKRLAEAGVKIVHLRVGVYGRWNVEIKSAAKDAPYCPNLRPIAFAHLRSLLEEFLGWLAPRAFHIHSLVGFDWVATTGLLATIRDSAIPYFWTLHDYSVVCHRNDLVKPDGRFCDLPTVDVCRACLRSDQTYPEAIDPAVRQQTFGSFLAGAAAVFAPSTDIATRLRNAGVPYEIVVRPHEQTYTVDPLPRPSDDATTIDIVTIGAIGPHKGSRLLLSLARDAKTRKLPLRFHIVGYSDMSREMADAGVQESGRYETEAEAVALAREIRPAYVLLPSIWPETYCYALSLAFMIDVPPIVFDLGAQHERVDEAKFGVILPYDLVHDIKALNDRLAALPIARPSNRHRTPQLHAYRDIRTDYYPADILGRHGTLRPVFAGQLTDATVPH